MINKLKKWWLGIVAFFALAFVLFGRWISKGRTNYVPHPKEIDEMRGEVRTREARAEALIEVADDAKARREALSKTTTDFLSLSAQEVSDRWNKK